MKANELMEYKSWVVAGDVLNVNKFASKIFKALDEEGYEVVGLNPKEKDDSVFNSLEDIKKKIDVIDLCINPKRGLEIVKAAKEIGVNKVLMQPGAESDEIIDFCKENGIEAVKGCVLVELNKH